MKNRKLNVLVVTGVSSFIGVHLARFFAKKGYRVIGTIRQDIGKYDSLGRMRLRAAQAAGVELMLMDLTDLTSVSSLIKRELPAVWVHHAGWATNYGSLNYDSGRGYTTNVAPLEGLWQALKKYRCQGVIVTGSSAEYSDSYSACNEQDACWPTTPYGLSKLSEIIRARQLAQQYGIRTRVARVFIPYGPMDAPGKLITSVVRGLRSEESIDLSPCEQQRDFIYIGDLIRGYGALVDDLHRDELFDVFNLCSGEATSLRRLLHELADLLGVDPRLLHFGARTMRPSETQISYGSNAKAQKILGWHPQPLHEGLRAYVQETAEMESLYNVETEVTKEESHS